MDKKVRVIGAGLAGSEAAWQLAKCGYHVDLYEMRPQKTTPAHTTDKCAELVCSNSLRSDDWQTNAVGLLHEELRRCASLIISCADETRVPAGGALAVDREAFSSLVTQKLSSHPLITFHHEEVTDLDFSDDIPTILATGPLTSEKMADCLQKITGDEHLHFFDAIAPIVYTNSVDMSQAWYQSRYDKGDKYDYLNLPMNKDQYENFVADLLTGEKVEFHEWEKDTPYFEGCLPIEVMAERGPLTLRFGPMKPVGLTNPHDPEHKPFAIVQLRKENKEGTLMNLVGFQTKLKHGAQKEIFSKIPGLENAVFARLGGIHRNTFVCGPKVLDERLHLKNKPNVILAGQVSGCEGYVESTSMGFIAAQLLANPNLPLPPAETALGSMLRHVTEGNAETFQPMNINFGIFPELPKTSGRKIKGADRKKLYTARALSALDEWMKNFIC
ncbi:MAG: methylenetetrahydrofolate--tRNA-(uracil(54)-C(5))-methyltransferase (FADH(2)-oxidizing) TrmFO [Alphaproteobacteria bacterium]|nr:methylenetetrahydrofolate--tRNA-(uracil(54)-C(5))-methyltransferase (FADH(2)-oxidizing) TrmFO [Alphaproteobacteria bacterium]